MHFLKISIFTLTAVLLLRTTCWATTVAVFPVEDLSQGSNGVNFEFSKFISHSLKEKGLDIVPMDQLISFMARKRIRRLGFLDTGSIHKLSVDFGAQYIVFTTITQLKEENGLSLGLVVHILRTTDGTIIWSKSQGLNDTDTRKMLALAEPQSVNDLLFYLVEDLFADFSVDHVTDTDDKSGEIIIQEVEISPKHARSGTEMSCTITQSRKDNPDSSVDFLLSVGGNENYKMTPYLKSGLRASWPASAKEGSKPVSLIINTTSDKKILYLGSYTVDNSPPELDIRLQGVKLDKRIIFSNTLPIIPIWQKMEPLNSWKISIIKKGGETVLSNENTGALPPRFDWKGQGKDGNSVDQGVYQVRLQVWDRASNLTTVTHEVEYHRDKPDPKIKAEAVGEKLVVTLDYQQDTPLKYWTARVLFSDGEPLAEIQGDSLPAEIILPAPNEDEKRAMECLVEYHDVLGNMGRKQIKDLRQLLISELLVIEEEIIEDEWLESF